MSRTRTPPPTRPPEGDAFVQRLSTPPDDPTLFARDPFGPLARRFHDNPLSRPPLPRQASPAGLCSTTRPADESAAPDPRVRFPEPRQRAPEGTRRPSTMPSEEHRLSNRHRAPLAGYPSILVVPPNSEGQECPSFHRRHQDPALQHAPRRAHLGYGSDAFHRRPPGTAKPVSEPEPRLSRIVRPAAVSSQRDGDAFFASREPPTFDGHHDL